MESSSNSGLPKPGWKAKLAGNPLAQVFSIRDFRLLWIGAFFSFTGSWVQNVCQGYLIYEMTKDESKLAYVSAANSIPFFLFGLAAGSLVDTRDKRHILIGAQILFACASLYMAAATHFRFVSYEQVILVSFMLGTIACVEAPTRQSVVSRVVPVEFLSAAIPIQAMTFNTARIIGPAIGGVLLANVGVPVGYLVNALTFMALIGCVAAMRADLSPATTERVPFLTLIKEGIKYTWNERRLRTLLIMESVTALFGIFYIPMMPAYIDQVLKIPHETPAGKLAIGNAYTAIGVGALCTLLLMTQITDAKRKGRFITIGMAVSGLVLWVLANAQNPWLAFPLMSVIGACTVLQFNTTNALFQTIAPEHLRGRALSAHIWALNGLSPFGVAILGTVARQSRDSSFGVFGSGIPLAMHIGACLMICGALFGFANRGVLRDLT
ncbi:ProP Permeases of the major facilitator superfamily [Fimbriimonadaceae bacterium]